jgi:hypothetical protein
MGCKKTKTVLIKSNLVTCEGVSTQKCMEYQLKGEDSWQLFYGEIEGFTYEEGYKYELEVDVEKVANPPADGSSLKYSLKEVIKKEKDLAMISMLTASNELKETQEKNNPLAVYDSHTRGYHYTLTVYDTYATVLKEYKGTPRKVTVEAKVIDELKKIIENVSVDKIGTYEAPTKKRYYDGAPITTIAIFRKGEKFTSQAFDGGFPPKALEVLVNKVLSLSAEK